MAKSVFRSFVGGVRGVLGLQFLIAIAAAGVSGYTMFVTSDVMRERDAARAEAAKYAAYIEDLTGAPPGADLRKPEYLPEKPPETAPEPVKPPEETPPPDATGAPANPETPTAPPEGAQNPEPPAGIGAVLGQIMSGPPLKLLAVHVRSEADIAMARRLIAATKLDAEMQVSFDVVSPRLQISSSYVYFDQRQVRSAAAVVARFQDAAKSASLEPWAAPLPPVLRAPEGGYTSERLDLTLPALNPQPNTRVINPNVLRPGILERVTPAPPPPNPVQ